MNGWISFEGSQHAELDTDWDGPGGSLNGEPASVKIYQDLVTVPGESYNVKFAFSPRPGTGSSDNVLQVKLNGVVAGTITAAGGSNTLWTQHSYSFLANSNVTRIEFTDLGTANSLGTFLDGVSAKCVPLQEFPVCGNGIIEGSEQCDGGSTCTEQCTLIGICPA